jgi:outer membrane protein assembly factor BamA
VIREDLDVRENDILTGSYQQDSRSLSFRISHWLDPDTVSQGWLLGGGMAVSQQIYAKKTGVAESYKNSQALEVNFGLDYSAVQEFPYHREGSAYGYGGALALTGIGSEYSYNRHLFYHRNYHALQRVDANLNTQLKVGLANGNTNAFNLGGGSSLRGYESDVAVGNAMLQLNVEYHHHLSGYRQLRGVVFMDAGNAWPGVMEVDLGKLFSSVGLGLRWRVQSFVDLTLRVDTAYALDTGATKVYATTTSSF